MNVDLYRKLFVHRSDVFAQQNEKGNYAPVGEGHYDRTRQRFVYDSYTPLDDTHIEEHLAGMASYGVYVLDAENTCKHVVFDLDTYDADALDFLTRAVERLVNGAYAGTRVASMPHSRCLLLEDSGGKGYHVWLFLSEPVQAARVREWTEAVRRQYVQLANTVAPGSDKWPPLEIFPKQDEVPEGAFGNLVKLPFGVHAKSKAQALAIRRPGWANTLEDVVPFPSSLVPAQPESASKPETARGGRAPFACVSKILEDGAPSGCRDNAMYHFARYAVGTGLPDDLVGEWCERVNQEFDPPMTEQEVRVKVRSACSASTAHPGCSADWLRDFCPGGPHCFAPWNERESGAGKTRAEDAAEAKYPASMTPQERQAWRRANAGNAD